MRYRHCHPINILETTSRFWGLLILPVLRALRTLLFSGIDLRAWLQGPWFDITTLCAILALGFVSWYRYVYCLDTDCIRIRKGILLVKYRSIPYHRLSVLSVERPWYLLPFGAVHVSADTDGGAPTAPDFEITIRRRDAAALIDRCRSPFARAGDLKRIYLPKNIYIALLSLIASNSLTGVLFVSTLISGTGRVLGQQFETRIMQQLTDLANLFAFGIPPAAAVLAFTVLGGWLVSFAMNLVRHLRFCALRQGGAVDVTGGLVTRREYIIAVRRINLIELRQSLLTKLFGFYSAFIHANGYGKKKDELSVLMPAGESGELSQNLLLLLPEIPVCSPQIRPRIRYLSRFLIPPLTWIGAVTAAWILGMQWFPLWSEVFLYIGLMAEAPCVWYLLVKLVSYFHTGVGVGDDVFTFRYTYGYRIKTVAVPRRRIIKVTIRRSLFQVMSGCCDLVILTYSEGRKRHVVPNLNFREAKAMLQAEGYYSAASTRWDDGISPPGLKKRR